MPIGFVKRMRLLGHALSLFRSLGILDEAVLAWVFVLQPRLGKEFVASPGKNLLDGVVIPDTADH